MTVLKHMSAGVTMVCLEVHYESYVNQHGRKRRTDVMPFRNGQNGYTSHFQHNIAFITDKNTISMEELYILNPDVILLGNEDAYKEVMNSSLWKNLDAVLASA